MGWDFGFLIGGKWFWLVDDEVYFDNFYNYKCYFIEVKFFILYLYLFNVFGFLSVWGVFFMRVGF